jgi:hypothetical protein
LRRWPMLISCEVQQHDFLEHALHCVIKFAQCRNTWRGYPSIREALA